MRKNTWSYILLSLLLFTCIPLKAVLPLVTDTLVKSSLNMSPSKIEVRGDSLYIECDISFRFLVASSTQAVKLTPFISCDDRRYDLPSIIINGKRRAPYYRREQYLSKPAYNICYKAVTQIGAEQQLFYKIAIPFQSWMANASLYLAQKETGKSKEVEIKTEKWMMSCVDASSLITGGDEKAYLTRRAKEKEYTLIISDSLNTSSKVDIPKMIDASGSSEVIFRQGVSDVSNMIANNTSKLKELAEIVSDSSFSIKKIRIIAMCSPEGTYYFNEALANARAQALRKYLCSNYQLCNDSLYQLQVIPEDWDSLAKLVSESSFPNKEEVLEIIQTVPVFSGREKKIMELHNGTPYRYMYRYLFPLLRRAEVQIDYIKSELENKR